jgi:hypothetical protein
MSEALIGFCGLILLFIGLGVWAIASEISELTNEIRRGR